MECSKGPETGRFLRIGSRSAGQVRGHFRSQLLLRGLLFHGLWGTAGLALVGCGAADVARADGSASLEAVLSIERLEDAGRADAPSASAMAQFVILPSDADVHDTLGAAGLRNQLPGRSGCVDLATGEAQGRANRSSSGSSTSGARSGFAREPLELLEAGDVSIQAGEMLTRLALNSFPPSGSASGVIYTTPDQSAAPLPPDENYSIRATGSGAIPPLSIAGRAPAALLEVTVGGLPLERSLGVVAGQPLDITWAEGIPGDRIFVELADPDHNFACSFPDEDGSGSLPGALTAQLDPRNSTAVRLSVHRIREAVQSEISLEDGHVDTLGDGSSLETTVRFDFETTAVLRVQ